MPELNFKTTPLHQIDLFLAGEAVSGVDVDWKDHSISDLDLADLEHRLEGSFANKHKVLTFLMELKSVITVPIVSMAWALATGSLSAALFAITCLLLIVVAPAHWYPAHSVDELKSKLRRLAKTPSACADALSLCEKSIAAAQYREQVLKSNREFRFFDYQRMQRLADSESQKCSEETETAACKKLHGLT